MGKDKGNNRGTGYQAKTERAGTIMPTMNEWQQQIAEERKAQEKWQTMTLEELEAEKLRFQGKLPFKLQMAWAKAKADRVNGVTHARMRPLRSRPVRISTK